MAENEIRLAVPFIRQHHQNSCGAAAMEMIYRYLGHQVNQAAIFEQMKELEPHGSGEFCITVLGILEDALRRGLYAASLQLEIPNPEACFDFCRNLVNANIPLVACQRFTPDQPLIGHFRIVVGTTGDALLVHDPMNVQGYEPWPPDNFLRAWQQSGENVLGNQGVFILNERHPQLPPVEQVRQEITQYKAEMTKKLPSEPRH